MTSLSVSGTFHAPAPSLMAGAYRLPVRAVLDGGECPRWLRRCLRVGLYRHLDHTNFATLLHFGFSVSASRPLRSVTMTRPLTVRPPTASRGNGRTSALFGVGRVEVRLKPQDGGTEVTVACAWDQPSPVISPITRAAWLPLSWVLTRCMTDWLHALAAAA